ncbi:MAG TPA: DUF4870 domain-containing protein [Dermatophilaceae bacterium]|jgi:uncharacterized Tic20 family protein
MPQQPYGEQPPYSAPPPPPGQAPAYGYPPQAPVSPSDARMWSIFAHLGGTFLSFFVPLVIYLVFKDRDPFVRRHSAQALNFHITLFIVYVVSVPLILIIVGIFTIIAAAICAVVFTVIAALAANDGREYTYPLAIRFVS